MIEDGLIDRDLAILAFVKWNTSDDIYEMMKSNEMLDSEEDELEDE
jgi:hypothetical protein